MSTRGFECCKPIYQEDQRNNFLWQKVQGWRRTEFKNVRHLYSTLPFTRHFLHLRFYSIPPTTPCGQMSIYLHLAAEGFKAKRRYNGHPRSHMDHKWQTRYPSPDFLIPSPVLEGCESVKSQVSPVVEGWTQRIGLVLRVSLRNVWISAQKSHVHTEIKYENGHIFPFFSDSPLCANIRTVVITQS